MRFLDFVVLLVLIIFLVVGMYFLWYNFPTEPTLFENYVENFSEDLPLESAQFNSNMRYSDKRISYGFAPNCSLKKKNDFRDATDFLETRTILDFYEADSPEIQVSCSNIAPEPDDEGHFVAGEGGPKVIVNASRFAVILIGNVALYRPESCAIPQVATHEILHALGFDHNSNPKSIMFPVTNCEQTLEQSVIDEVDRLYSIPSAADLVIKSFEANKTGRYMNFEAVIANYGLKDVKESSLKIIVGDEVIEIFDTSYLNIGARKSLTLTNLKIPRDTEKIFILIETPEQEISKENNQIELNTVR